MGKKKGEGEIENERDGERERTDSQYWDSVRENKWGETFDE